MAISFDRVRSNTLTSKYFRRYFIILIDFFSFPLLFTKDVVISLRDKLCLSAEEHFSLVLEHVKSLKRNKLTLLDPDETLARVRRFTWKLLSYIRKLAFIFNKTVCWRIYFPESSNNCAKKTYDFYFIWGSSEMPMMILSKSGRRETVLI